MQESTVFCCGNGECLSRSALSFASTEIKITAGSVGDIVASTKFIKKENKHVCNIYVVWSCMGVLGNTALHSYIHDRIEDNWTLYSVLQRMCWKRAHAPTKRLASTCCSYMTRSFFLRAEVMHSRESG